MKRLFDLTASLVALIVFSPIFIVLVILIRLNLGTPVFFRQERPGYKGQIFNLIKFRTMTSEIDKNGQILPDEKRLTRFGKFLRSTSLDELPSLWCIFKGEMSLVGPRPLLVEYLPLYSNEQARRHDVKPGLTGWAQVNGRNAIGWDEKFRLDIWYVENQTFLLDLKILLLTLKKVFKREGVTAEGHVTTEKFNGNQGAD